MSEKQCFHTGDTEPPDVPGAMWPLEGDVLGGARLNYKTEQDEKGIGSPGMGGTLIRGAQGPQWGASAAPATTNRTLLQPHCLQKKMLTFSVVH